MKAFISKILCMFFACMFACVLFTFGTTTAAHAVTVSGVTYPFSITTTSIAANKTFSFTLRAKGTFYIDCGAGGTLSGSGTGLTVSGGTVTTDRTTTNYSLGCRYTSAGVKTIQFGGQATDYASGGAAAIAFQNNYYIQSLNGDLSAVFPYISSTKYPCFYKTFYGCTALTSISTDLFQGITGGGQYMFNGTFQGCTALTSLPEGLFRNVTSAANYMFGNTFYGCTNVRGYIPASMFAGLVANGHPTATGFMSTIFANVNYLVTSCPSGTTKVTTGYESNWGSKVACIGSSTVTYSCGDGSGTAPSTTTVTQLQSFTPATSTCTGPGGGGFKGWLVSGTNDIKPAGTAFVWQYLGNKTLTAQYSKFSVTTTSIAANGTFSFKLSAQGTFYVDCGSGGTLSGTGVSGTTITKSSTTSITYTCTYSSAGTKTIQFDGVATGYSTANGLAAISFEYSGALLSSISGDLSKMFPYMSGNATDGAQPRFYRTFYNATNLTQIPTTLFSGYTNASTYMFSQTFYGCTGLTSIPATLFNFGNISGGAGMFQYTFDGCTSLTSIPASLFPNFTSGGYSMFNGTFQGCTGLISIPETLFNFGGHNVSGYEYMFGNTFDGCTSLTSIPANLFQRITSIEQGSVFAATFSGCTGLTSIPETLFNFGGHNVSGYENMFSNTFNGCTSLTSIPANLFQRITNASNGLFVQTFRGCTGLTSIPETLFNFGGNNVEGQELMFWYTFAGCTSLTSIPENLFQRITSGAHQLFDHTFSGCTGLTSIPENLFSHVTSAQAMFYGTFDGCTGLRTLPENLFSNITSAESSMFYQTFRNCTGLTGYVPKTLFSGLIANNSPYAGSGTAGMMSQIFYNSGLLTACPKGTSQYTTGYESYWNSKKSCEPASYTCAAGKYLPANSTSCSNCPAGNYCAGGTYTFNTSSAQGITGVCNANTYSTGGASTATCTSCASGYTTSGTAASNHDNANDCKITCSAGTYVASASGSCTNVGSGYYRATSETTSQGSTGTRNACSGLTAPSVTGGTFSSVSPYNATTTCRYVAPDKTKPTNCASITKNTVSYSGSAWGTNFYSVTANAGSYISANGSANPACTACPTGSYTASAGSQTSCTVCGSTDATKGKTTSAAGQTSCNVNCSNNNKVYAWANASWSSGSVSNVCKVTSCSAGSYYSSSGNGSCTNCADGSYMASSGHTNTSCSLCSALSGVSPSGGTYSTGGSTGSTANTACKYTAPSKTITGCKTVTSQAVTYSGTAWPASTYGVTANKGYVIANNNSSSATCTQCTSGYYQATDGSTATSCSACSGLTAPSVTGGTFSSVSPYNATTTCRYVAPDKTKPTNCATITKNTVSYSGSAWGTNFYSVTANAGSYISANGSANPACTACPVGSYTASAGTQTSCTVCGSAEATMGKTTSAAGQTSCNANCSNSSGVYSWTTASWTSGAPANVCKVAGCAKGTAYSSSGNGSCTACATGTYMASENHTNTSCSACSALSGVSPSGGTYTTASTGSTASTACKYTAPSKTITGCKTVTSQAVTYSGTAWPASTYGVTANKGYVIANNNSSSATCTQCTSGYYQATDGSTATSCSACSGLTAPSVTGGTFSSVSPYDANTTCRYVAPDKTKPTNCATITKNTVSYSGSAWGTNFYSVTANAGSYISANGSANPACTQCATGAYTASAGTQTSCSVCGSGTTTSAAGQTSCNATCSNNNAYDHAWATPNWNNNSPTGLCKITSCKAGSYYTSTNSGNTNTCTACAAGNYKSGDGHTSTSCSACPAAATYKRTTFPDNYYSPTITSTSVVSGTGLSAITQCYVLSWLDNTRGTLYEYANYNSTSGKYDATTSYGWDSAKAGYYLTDKGGCGTYAYYRTASACPAGNYCPGKAHVVCNSSNQSTVHTTNFGLESCPTNWTSDAGATANTNCYRSIVLNKNGASGTINSVSGTNNAAQTCYYNTDCTLPVTTSMTLANTVMTGGWCTSSSCTSSTRTFKITDTAATVTYYAGKSACGCTNCTTSVSSNTCGGTCSTGYSTSGYLNTGTSASCSGTSCSCTPRTYKVTLDPKRYTSTSDTTGTAATSNGTTAYWYVFNTNNPSYFYTVEIQSSADMTTANKLGSNGYTITKPTLTGYTFGGYFVTKTGTGNQYIGTDGGAINNLWSSTGTDGRKNITLYAKWTAQTSAVTLNKNTSSSDTTTVATVTATYNSAMPTKDTSNNNLSAPTRSKANNTTYAFNGYYDARTGGTQYYTAAAASARSWNKTGAQTLYAQWTMSCDAGYYLPKNTLACSACPGGKYCSGGTAYTFNSSSDQGITGDITAGYYSSGGASTATGTTCLSGYNCGSCASSNGSNGRPQYSAAGASSCTECPAVTGTLANRATGRYAYYPSVHSNGPGGCYAYFTDSDDDATFDTLCYYNATDGTYGGTNSSCQIYAPSACAAGKYNTIASTSQWVSAGSYASCKGVDCMKGKVCTNTTAGYYSPANTTTQTACATGSYSSAGAASCTACPGGKTTTGTGTAFNTNANTTCATTCSNSSNVRSGTDGWETPSWSANTLTNLCTIKSTGCVANSYKNSNACSTCSSGTSSKYTLSAVGTTTVNNCYLTTTAKKYVASAGSGEADCTAGNYCPGGTTVYYGGTHSSSHLTTGGQTQCPANSYCVAKVSSATACSTVGGGLYTKSAAGSDENTDCYITTTAGKYVAASTDTAQTMCPVKKYCESVNLYYPNVGDPDNANTVNDGIKSCPVADSTTARTTYPSNYYNPTRNSISNQSWSTGLTTIEACMANYSYTNARGNFTTESIGYSSTSGKYDRTNGTPYYTKINAGYYGSTRYSSTYCDNTTTRSMLYQDAQPCPTGSYCPGLTSMPLCSSGTYAETVGIYSCSASYSSSAANSDDANDCYLTTSSKKYVASAGAGEVDCNAGYYCPGGSTIYAGGSVSGRSTTGGRTSCPANSYCPAKSSTHTTCSSATSSKYTISSANSTSVNDCKVQCAAGTRVATINAACTTPAGPWVTTAAHYVNYGRISQVTRCMYGYQTAGTAASNHDAITDCTISVGANKYIPAMTLPVRYIKLTSGGSTANSGTYMVEVEAYTSNDATGTNLLAGKGGISGSNMTAATDGSWSRSPYSSGSPEIWDLGAVKNIGSIKFSTYPDGRVFTNFAISVSADNSNWTTILNESSFPTDNVSTAVGEVIKLSGVPTNCASGYNKAAHTLTYGNTSSCSANTISATFDGTTTNTCDYDGTLNVPTPSARTGYYFVGWEPEN